MTKRQISLLQAILTSAFFGAIVTFLPWEIWRGAEFADIANYIARLERIAALGVRSYDLNGTIADLLSGEYLWTILLNLSVEWGIDQDMFLNSIGFSSSTLACFFVSRKLGPFAAFALMLNPLSIDLYNSQIRSAFAFTLILIGYALWSRGRYSKVPAVTFLFSTPFIHTSMVLIVFLGALATVMVKKLKVAPEIRNLTSLTASILAAGMFVYFGNLALSAIGDRRTLSADAVRSASFVLFWILCALMYSFQKSSTFSQSVLTQYSIGVLAFSSVAELLGAQAFRLITVSLPIVFSSLSYLSVQYRNLIVSIMIAYNILQFTYWLSG
jgi:hypothetical protein